MQSVLQLIVAKGVDQQAVVNQTPQIKPGEDIITEMLTKSGAARGADTLPWRICPGMISTRYVDERFIIFSIPHLIFEECDEGRMKKKEPGQGMILYERLRKDAVEHFPNLAASKNATRSDGKKVNSNNMPDTSAAVRNDLQRNEIVFKALLQCLDNATDEDQLPKKKQDWAPYIAAGVTVMANFATIAFGYPKGGAKVTSASSQQTALNKFHPAQLWPGSPSFRE